MNTVWLHEDDSYSAHQVDHMLRGSTEVYPRWENLAYACLRCNAWKGSDTGSVDSGMGHFVAFFNPRRHEWYQHFRLQGFVIEPLTPEARSTARVLRLDSDKRVVERRALMITGPVST